MYRKRRRRNDRFGTRRHRCRPHDMWEPDDYDFADDLDVETWMIALATNGEQQV